MIRKLYHPIKFIILVIIFSLIIKLTPIGLNLVKEKMDDYGISMHLVK